MTCTVQGGTGFNFDATFIHMHLTRTHIIKSHRPRKTLEDWRRFHNAVMYWLPAIAHLPLCPAHMSYVACTSLPTHTNRPYVTLSWHVSCR